MRWMPRRSLFLRIVSHGVILLGASAVGFLVILLLLVESSIDRKMKDFGEWFGSEACRRAADPQMRASVLTMPAAVAVYAHGGERVAASAAYAGGGLSAKELARLRAKEWIDATPGGLLAAPCPGDPARYVVFGRPPAPVPIGRLAWMTAILVISIALGSIPLARSIVRPLRRLTLAARALGAGALDTRAEVLRRDELGELASSFNAMAGQLQDRLRMERELLANVSHELRTPLARARVVLETALDEPARAAALLGEIARDLGELERLTDDVLGALRLDFVGGQSAGGLALQLQPTELARVVRDAMARFAETYPDRELSLEVAVEVGEVMILADPPMLGRLIANLLDNARKYSSLEIAVRIAPASEGEVQVQVEDRGIGIDADELDRVFDPFFRSSRGRASGASGTGLGLTLCRRIVQAHRGQLTLRSEPGRGTTVVATFPRSSLQAAGA